MAVLKRSVLCEALYLAPGPLLVHSPLTLFPRNVPDRKQRRGSADLSRYLSVAYCAALTRDGSVPVMMMGKKGKEGHLYTGSMSRNAKWWIQAKFTCTIFSEQ